MPFFRGSILSPNFDTWSGIVAGNKNLIYKEEKTKEEFMKKIIAFIALNFVLTAGGAKPPAERAEMPEEIFHRLESVIDSLHALQMRDYAPAKQLLRFLIEDPVQAKGFLEKYDERGLEPYLPPAGHSRTFWQRHFVDPMNRDISHAAKEADIFHYGHYLLPAMAQLREIFESLDLKQRSELIQNATTKILHENHSKVDEELKGIEAREKSFARNNILEPENLDKFNKRHTIERQKNLRTDLSQRCEKVFADYFRLKKLSSL